jgi:hypothetical protein
MMGAVVGAGLGGAATFFYLRQQQAARAPTAPRGADAGFGGAATQPVFKHGVWCVGGRDCVQHAWRSLLCCSGQASVQAATAHHRAQPSPNRLPRPAL